MKRKSLSKTNPFLVKKANARGMLIRSTASSTAIETGKPVSHIESKLNLRKPTNRAKLA